ncbi:MAG: hypothetical protein FWE09_01160, partial [Treponema sp.]|nr:hypothetical protein [Treponema sp.]
MKHIQTTRLAALALGAAFLYGCSMPLDDMAAGRQGAKEAQPIAYFVDENLEPVEEDVGIVAFTVLDKSPGARNPLVISQDNADGQFVSIATTLESGEVGILSFGFDEAKDGSSFPFAMMLKIGDEEWQPFVIGPYNRENESFSVYEAGSSVPFGTYRLPKAALDTLDDIPDMAKPENLRLRNLLMAALVADTMSARDKAGARMARGAGLEDESKQGVNWELLQKFAVAADALAGVAFAFGVAVPPLGVAVLAYATIVVLFGPEIEASANDPTMVELRQTGQVLQEAGVSLHTGNWWDVARSASNILQQNAAQEVNAAQGQNAAQEVNGAQRQNTASQVVEARGQNTNVDKAREAAETAENAAVTATAAADWATSAAAAGDPVGATLASAAATAAANMASDAAADAASYAAAADSAVANAFAASAAFSAVVARNNAEKAAVAAVAAAVA